MLLSSYSRLLEGVAELVCRALGGYEWLSVELSVLVVGVSFVAKLMNERRFFKRECLECLFQNLTNWYFRSNRRETWTLVLCQRSRGREQRAAGVEGFSETRHCSALH
jgi:hypothetical protein